MKKVLVWSESTCNRASSTFWWQNGLLDRFIGSITNENLAFVLIMFELKKLGVLTFGVSFFRFCPLVYTISDKVTRNCVRAQRLATNSLEGLFLIFDFCQQKLKRKNIHIYILYNIYIYITP